MKDLKELFESLEIEKEALDTIVKKAETIVEAKVKDQAEKAKEEIQEQLNQENESWREEQLKLYEEKFEEYEKQMTEKFSEFVDHVIKEEIKIPDRVMEYARKGQIYEPIIEEFKTKIAIDQGLIEDEVKSLLSEAKEKILELQEKYDQVFGENLNLSEKSQKFEVKAHLLEKCEELTLEQRQFVVRVLGDADSVEEVDEKFDAVLEMYGLGGEKMSGKKTEGTTGPGMKEAGAEKEKGEGFKTAKDTKKEKAKKATGAEGDEETMGSQGEKKIPPEKQAKEDDDVKGKGTINEDDEEDEKTTDPRMKEYKRLFEKRNW